VKLLVRATNWIGDAVMSLPALEAARARWPQAEIVLLARPWMAGIYRDHGVADRVIEFERPPAAGHRGLAGLERLARELRAERFDAALLLQNAFQAAWLAWRAGIAERIGYARDGRSWLLTRAVPVPRRGEIPALEPFYYLELVRRAGWLDRLPERLEIRLRVAPASLERAEQTLAAAGSFGERLRIAIAPGAAFGPAKCWPAERYAELADRLIAAFAADVVLFGAPAERQMCERIAGAMVARPAVLAGRLGVAELPAALARCGLFIGNDSGAMHVAAAVGLPVVGIFGPTDPDATSPATARFRLVRHDVECSPCMLRHCPIDHRCMTRIGVAEVLAAAAAFLRETK
jgi:heptosyltransferase-2